MIGSPQTHQAISLAMTVLLALLPPLFLYFGSLELLEFFFIGGMAWGAGVAVKLLLARVSSIQKTMKAGAVGAALWGMISGFAEIGALWIVVAADLLPLQAQAGIACGFGAASFEIFYLIVVGAIEEHRHPDPAKYHRWEAAARKSYWVANIGIIERSGATVIHVVARWSLFVGLAHAAIIPVANAVLSITLVDGLATYGVARKWDWFNPRTCRAFYLSVFGAGAVGWLILSTWMLVRAGGT